MDISTLNVIILVLNLLVLTWYSIETFLVRKATQRTSKHNTEPLLMLNFSANTTQQGLIDDDMDIDDVILTLSNIGGGVATNIKIEPIKNLCKDDHRDVVLRLPQTNILFPAKTERLAVSEFENGTKIRGGHPHPYLVPRMAIRDDTIQYDLDPRETHWKDHSYSIKMSYNDQNGKVYTTHLLVDKNGVNFVKK